jgi:hypothetical protein
MWLKRLLSNMKFVWRHDGGCNIKTTVNVTAAKLQLLLQAPSPAHSQLQFRLPVVLVVRPLAHFVHAVLPAEAANVPTAQAVQVVLDSTNPGLQQAQSFTPPTAGILQDWQPRPHPTVVRVVLLLGGEHVLFCA